MADPLPHIDAEDLDRWAQALPQKDARKLRAYVAAMEARPEVWFQRTLQAIEAGLQTIRSVADSAEAQGKINGGNISTLRGLVDGLPARLEGIVQPVSAEAGRLTAAEAARVELANEEIRIRLEAQRRANEREHAGAMEGRELLRNVLSKAPWPVIIYGLLSMAAGGSLSELLHLFDPTHGTEQVEAGAP